MHSLVWLSMELKSVVFINDMTANRCSRMNSELNRAIISGQVLVKCSKMALQSRDG